MTIRLLRFCLSLLIACVLFCSETAFAAPSLASTSSATLPSGFAVTVKRIRVAADGSVYAVGTSATGFSNVSADGTTVTTTNYSTSIPAQTQNDFFITGNSIYMATTVGANGRILRFDVSGNTASLVTSSNHSGSGAISMLPPDANYFYVSRSSGIRKYASTTSTAVSATSSVSNVISRMAVTSDEILYYLSSSGSLFRSTGFSSATDTTLITDLGNAVSANSLVVGPNSSSIYIGYSTSIRKYTLPTSGSPTLLWTKSYSNTLSGMDLDPSGKIYTAQFNGTLDVYSPINAVSSFSATPSGTSVNLSWTTGVSDSDFAGVTIRRSTTAYPTTTTEGTAVTIDNTDSTYVDSGLALNTTYYYTIFNKTSDGFYSAAVSDDAKTPTSSPNLSAAKPVLNGTTINLSWDVPDGTDTFTLQRSKDSGAYTTVQTGIASSTTTYNDTTLSDGTYTYQIFAVDAYGNVSSAGTSSTLTIDTTAPNSPNLSAAKPALNGTTINSSWDVPAETDTFTLQRSKDSGAYTTVQTGIASSTTTYNDTTLSDGTYTYQIFAVDAYGNVSNAGTSSTLTIDTTAPNSPNLSAAKPTLNGATINLSWDVPAETDTFTLQRSKDSGAYTTVQTGIASSTTTYNDTTLSDGTYTYQIFAVDAYGNASSAGTSSALTIDTTPPSAPGSFDAVADNTAVHLSWTNPLDGDFDSITIRRSSSSYPTSISNGSLVLQNSTALSLSDSSLSDGIYYYSIFAKDTSGNVSEAAHATTDIDTTAPGVPTDVTGEVDGTTIILTWTNPTNLDFDSITIRRSTDDFPAMIDDGDLVATGVTSGTAEDADLAPGTYYYSLFAEDILGNISEAANVIVVLEETPPPDDDEEITPTVITDMATAAGKNVAVLSGIITDGGSSNVTVVGFEYGQTTDYDSIIEDEGSFEGAFELAVTDLDCGTTYHYRAYAANETGTAYGADKTFESGSCASASDLSVTITAPTANVSVGSNAVFVVTIVNSQTDAVTGATAQLTLSENMSFVSAKIVVTGTNSNETLTASTNELLMCTGTNPVTCDIGTIPAGATVTMNVTVKAVTTGSLNFGVALIGAGDDSSNSSTTVSTANAVQSNTVIAEYVTGCTLNPDASSSTGNFVLLGILLLTIARLRKHKAKRNI